MSVCGVAGRQSPCKDKECVAVLCCADELSGVPYIRACIAGAVFFSRLHV